MTVPHEPFRIDVPQEVLDDLQQRLDRTRWPDQIPGSGWSYGSDREYLKELVEYWKDGFDWRAVEARANKYPQFTTTIDGQKLHFFHVKSKEAEAKPLLLMHGYPSSSLDFLDMIEPLTDPVAHGGQASDAFDVIVPSLFGYTFSGPTTESGWHHKRMGDAIAQLMTELGYDQFYSHGGDWGATISSHLGRAYPDRVKAIHINFVPSPGLDPNDTEATDEEREMDAALAVYGASETGYIYLLGTKPQTIAYGLVDSPVALAAWLVEKFQTWTDNDSDVDTTLTKDKMLATITAYWVTETGGSSGRVYAETGRIGLLRPDPERVEIPTAAAIFPAEIYPSTRRIAEKSYNIVHWGTQEQGGHFPASERPDLLVADIREGLRYL